MDRRGKRPWTDRPSSSLSQQPTSRQQPTPRLAVDPRRLQDVIRK
ncbi:uncharacterized protein G2W53_010142 [Senna tora]|uniref:Uncharacterized protein n=1 Tax=Senna tora TaxID=362788 RepID=A0A834WZE2_9FABA|nr:uncharacterized protein G2W53_010142 [Senna tora]